MWSNNVWNEFDGSLNRYGARQVSRITKMTPKQPTNNKPSYVPLRLRSKLPFEYETPSRSGAQNNPITNYDGMEIYKKQYFDFLSVQPLSTNWQTTQLEYEMPDYDDPVYKANVAQAKRDGIREDVIKVRFKPPLKMVKSSLQQSVGNLNQLIPFIIKAKEVDAIKTQLDQDIIMRALADSKTAIGESKLASEQLYNMLLSQTGTMNKNILSLSQLIDMARQGSTAPAPVGDQGIEVQPDQKSTVLTGQPAGEVLIRPEDVKDNTPKTGQPANITNADMVAKIIEKGRQTPSIYVVVLDTIKTSLEKQNIEYYETQTDVNGDNIQFTEQDMKYLNNWLNVAIKKAQTGDDVAFFEKWLQNEFYVVYPNNTLRTKWRLIFSRVMTPEVLSNYLDDLNTKINTNIASYTTRPPLETKAPTKGNGMKGTGKKQNKWIDHVKMYCDEHKCSWAEGLKRAKDSY
jgi:hypothetical protein